MTEPRIKGRLESSHFTGHPNDVQRRLDACLASDAANVKPGPTVRPEVVVIQAALAKVRSVPPITDAAGVYGSSTRQVVLEYKKLNGIVRQGQPFDDVVGRMTLTRLDDEMLNLPTPEPPKPDPIALTAVDVIVHFVGVNGATRPLTPNEVFPEAALAAYRNKPNRELVRIGQSTVTIRDASAALIEQHARQIESSFLGKSPGKVFIFGSSSGGRNALDLAIRLSRNNVPLALVALLDAAWFPNEAKNSPDTFIGEPTVAPRFVGSGSVSAQSRLNFFQRVGNHKELTRQTNSVGGHLLFTSSMAGKEVHGEVAGFEPRDMTREVRDLFFQSDDAAHVSLIEKARPRVRELIRVALERS